MTSWFGRTKAKPETTSKHLRGLREGYGEDEEEEKSALIVFGAPINPNSETAPVLFGKFVRYVLSKGLSCSELFEKQVPLKEVQLVQKRIQVEGDQIQLGNHTKNPYVIGELFKMYLAALPEPLLTHSFYDSFISVTNILHHKNQLSVLRVLLLSLPKGYRACVKTLLTLFNRLAEANVLSIERLASLFGSTFLRPAKEQFYMKEDWQSVQYLVTLLITECDSLLKPPPEKRTRDEEVLSLSGLYNGMRNRSEIHYFPNFLVDPLNEKFMSKMKIAAAPPAHPVMTPSIIAESSNPNFSSLVSPVRDEFAVSLADFPLIESSLSVSSLVDFPHVDSSNALSSQFVGEKHQDSVDLFSSTSFSSPVVDLPASSSSSSAPGPLLVPSLDYAFFAPSPWTSSSQSADIVSPLRNDGFEREIDPFSEPLPHSSSYPHHEDLISSHAFDSNVKHSLLDALDTPISATLASTSSPINLFSDGNMLVPDMFGPQEPLLPALEGLLKPAQNNSEVPIFLDDNSSLL